MRSQQSVFLMALDIASKYDEPYKTSYKEAAMRLRLPFWDYYRPRYNGGENVKFPGIIKNGMTSFPYDYSCPRVFTEESIMVRRSPDDKLVPMKNPLYQFWFPDGGLKDERDWDSMCKDVCKPLSPILLMLKGWKKVAFPRDHTVRYPKHNSDWGDSTETLNAVLNALRMDSNRLMVGMLINPTYKNYEVFATNGEPVLDETTDATRFLTGDRPEDSPSGSLEAIHGTYHGLIGGSSVPNAQPKHRSEAGGHMS